MVLNRFIAGAACIACCGIFCACGNTAASQAETTAAVTETKAAETSPAAETESETESETEKETETSEAASESAADENASGETASAESAASDSAETSVWEEMIQSSAWGSTQDEIIAAMGSEPSDQYSKDNGKYVLEYYDQKLDDIEGIVRFNLTDGKLKGISFFIPAYEEDTYKHFNDKYHDLYGDPDYTNNIGQIWYEQDENIGLAATDQMGGMINISFAPAT